MASWWRATPHPRTMAKPQPRYRLWPWDRRAKVCTGAVALPSSEGAAWRATMTPSGDRLEVRLQVCLPWPGVTFPGSSGDQPMRDASRTLAPSSLEKYKSVSGRLVRGKGWNAAAAVSARGAFRRPSIWSFRRFRIIAQSPKLSVTAHTILTMPELSSAPCRAAAGGRAQLRHRQDRVGRHRQFGRLGDYPETPERPDRGPSECSPG